MEKTKVKVMQSDFEVEDNVAAMILAIQEVTAELKRLR